MFKLIYIDGDKKFLLSLPWHWHCRPLSQCQRESCLIFSHLALKTAFKTKQQRYCRLLASWATALQLLYYLVCMLSYWPEVVTIQSWWLELRGLSMWVGWMGGCIEWVAGGLSGWMVMDGHEWVSRSRVSSSSGWVELMGIWMDSPDAFQLSCGRVAV